MKDWELYKFPGGKVGETRTVWGVYWWMLRNALSLCELRAINRITRRHITR